VPSLVAFYSQETEWVSSKPRNPHVVTTVRTNDAVNVVPNGDVCRQLEEVNCEKTAVSQLKTDLELKLSGLE